MDDVVEVSSDLVGGPVGNGEPGLWEVLWRKKEGLLGLCQLPQPGNLGFEVGSDGLPEPDVDPYTRHHLGGEVRFRDVVDGAQFEPLQLRWRIGLGGDEDDRYVGGLRVVLDDPACVEAAFVWHVYVEEHEIGVLCLHEGSPLRAPGGVESPYSLLVEHPFQNHDRGGIVIDITLSHSLLLVVHRPCHDYPLSILDEPFPAHCPSLFSVSRKTSKAFRISRHSRMTCSGLPSRILLQGEGPLPRTSAPALPAAPLMVSRAGVPVPRPPGHGIFEGRYVAGGILMNTSSRRSSISSSSPRRCRAPCLSKHGRSGFRFPALRAPGRYICFSP